MLLYFNSLIYFEKETINFFPLIKVFTSRLQLFGIIERKLDAKIGDRNARRVFFQRQWNISA